MSPYLKTVHVLDEQNPLIPQGSDYGSIPQQSHRDPEETAVKHEKSIGYLGALSISVNSLCGPALLQLPFQYQQSGLIPTTLCLIGVGVLAYFVTLHMANVVSKVPGNSNFDKTVEFSDPFRTFWGNRTYYMTQLIFYLCTISLNIAAIVDTAAVVDSFLGHTIGSYALAVDHVWGDHSQPIQEWHHGKCSRRAVKGGVCEPFSGIDVHNHGAEYSDFLISTGYIIAAAVFLPICLMDLKENTSWQIFGFFVTVTVSVQFIVSFLQHGISVHRVSWWGHDYSGMLGVIVFNYGLVLAMPALLSQKKPNVSTTRLVYSSVVVTTIMYVLVGALGGMALSNVNINMLKPMVSGAYGTPLQWAGWVFAFFIIGLDVPLFAVLTRYNLTSSGLCSKNTANWLVVYIPWGVSWLLYQGNAIGELLSWGGVLFTSAIAFLLPLYLAIRTLVVAPDAEGSIDVYGGHVKSKEAQKIALYIILFIAMLSVCLGIVGKADSVFLAEQLKNDPEYLNDGSNFTDNDSVDSAQ